MAKKEYDLIWKEGSLFEKGHWKLVPKSPDSGMELVGWLIGVALVLIILSLIALTIPIWAFFIGFLIRKEKRHLATIFSLIGLIYFWLDKSNQWLTSFLFIGYENEDGFTEGLLSVEYLDYISTINFIFFFMSIYFVFESYKFRKK